MCLKYVRFHTAEDLSRLKEGKSVTQNLEISADLKQGRVFKSVTQNLERFINEGGISAEYAQDLEYKNEESSTNKQENDNERNNGEN